MTSTMWASHPAGGRSRRKQAAVFLFAAFALAGCGRTRPPAAADSLSTRERQEAIGRSGLTGATGINRAIDVADSATARNRVLDSLGVKP